MAKNLTVILEDRPGTLAEMGEALGAAGVNIDGMCGFPCEGQGSIHILVEDVAGARQALEKVGVEIEAEREVLEVEAEDRPGMLGEVARKLANAGVNIDLFYKSTQTKIVFGVDDLQKGRAAFES
jgi:hypothetical protein